MTPQTIDQNYRVIIVVDEFISCYNEGDEKKLYKGKSLLFYSLSNNDAESRYLITDFLLNKGAETNVINECGENLLHICCQGQITI